MQWIFIWTLCLLPPVRAESGGPGLVVQNPFWRAEVERSLAVTVRAQDPRLKEDCRAYAEAAPRAAAAEDLEWARRLPLAGDMQDAYFAVFILGKDPVPKPRGWAEGYTEPLELIGELTPLPEAVPIAAEITAHSRWQQLSQRFGLPAAAIRLRRSGSEWQLHLEGRDVACDLLEGRTRLKMPAVYRMAPGASGLLKMNRVYGAAEEATNRVLQRAVSPAERAAALGLAYGKICAQAALEPPCIERLFAQLFRPQTLERNSSWGKLGAPVIVVPKQMQTPRLMAHLVMESAPDADLRRIEQELGLLKAMPYHRLTSRQRIGHADLLRRRARILKRQIFEKYGAYR